MPHDDIIAEQIEYYRKRAPGYDAEAAKAAEQRVSEGREIDAALDAFRPTAHVLEIACGTGLGTRRLLKHASAVTALDSSPEVIDLARDKLANDPRVRFVVADIFHWEPPERYDVVYFRFWLTHVPPERFEAFWHRVARALKPEGRVFFEDEMEGAFEEEHLDEPHLVRRATVSGGIYRVVKVFRNPQELEKSLRELGWDIRVHTVGLLIWGEGRRAD